jgi:transcriptional regulator with XRE-family HTH domain
MLPLTSDSSFRIALKKARLDANLSFSDLAKLAGISAVMPSRYENADHSNATLPNELTWKRLNEALFPNETDNASASKNPTLTNSSIDQIVAELKRRGALSVTINW